MIFNIIRNYLLIFFIIFLGIFYCLIKNGINYNIEKNKIVYNGMFYVITKEVRGDKIRYYKVLDGVIKEIDLVESDEFDDIFIVYDCIDEYSNNELTLNNCYLINQKGEYIHPNDTYIDIIENLSKLEHATFKVKIYKENNSYFVTRALNVNLSDPYELYEYDTINKKLQLMFKTTNEEIIGFKIIEQEKSQ